MSDPTASDLSGAGDEGVPHWYGDLGGERGGGVTGPGAWTYPIRANPVEVPHRRLKVVVLAAMSLVLIGSAYGAGIAMQRSNGIAPLVATTTPTLSSGDQAALIRAEQNVTGSLVDINSTFGIQHARGAGTGIVIGSNGLVVTNNHVVSGATNLSVIVTSTGATYSAKVVGYDRLADIALIQLLGARNLSAARFGSAATIGQIVVGMGNAGGVGGVPLAAPGRVTSLDQTVTAGDQLTGSKETLAGLIGTSTAIAPGDSGGPLVSANGMVVGMDTAAAVGSSTNSGFAIPIKKVLHVVYQIESGVSGQGIHIGATAYLGILSNPKTPGVGGVLVGGVAPGSPAALVLSGGDLLTSLDGSPITSIDSLTVKVLGLHPGQRVLIAWKVGGKMHSAYVTLAAGPAQ